MGDLVSCTRSGLKDWFLQRVSAVIIMCYALFIIVLLFCFTGSDNYHAWVATFQHTGVKVFTLLAFISLIFHAWIGMWTIFTDYIKCAWISGLLQIASILGYLACFIWLICILF